MDRECAQESPEFGPRQQRDQGTQTPHAQLTDGEMDAPHIRRRHVLQKWFQTGPFVVQTRQQGTQSSRDGNPDRAQVLGLEQQRRRGRRRIPQQRPLDFGPVVGQFQHHGGSGRLRGPNESAREYSAGAEDGPPTVGSNPAQCGRGPTGVVPLTNAKGDRGQGIAFGLRFRQQSGQPQLHETRDTARMGTDHQAVTAAGAHSLKLMEA